MGRYFWFDILLLFVVCLLETNQIFSRIHKPHYSNAYDITSKQVLVPKRGKKKYQHFLYPVNHRNQRNSPSATLTFIIMGEGRGYYDMGHVLLLFLTKITSFRHMRKFVNFVKKASS